MEHIYTPVADVAEQGGILAQRLRRVGRATFRRLIADCAGTHEVIARFLAVLELYRDGRVGFEQAVSLGELHVRWAAAAGEPGDEIGSADD